MVNIQQIEDDKNAKYDKLSDEEKTKITRKKAEAVTQWANHRIVAIETAHQNAANSRLLFK